MESLKASLNKRLGLDYSAGQVKKGLLRHKRGPTFALATLPIRNCICVGQEAEGVLGRND